MSITIEVDGAGARVVDTTYGQAGSPLDLKASMTVTKWSRKWVTIADGVSDQTIQFDSVSAGKVLVLRASGRITAKVNGSSTAVPVHPELIVTDQTTAGITSCTISNGSGSAVTVEVLIGG